MRKRAMETRWLKKTAPGFLSTQRLRRLWKVQSLVLRPMRKVKDLFLDFQTACLKAGTAVAVKNRPNREADAGRARAAADVVSFKRFSPQRGLRGLRSC